MFALTTAKTQRVVAAAKEYVKMGVEVIFIVSPKEDEDVETLYPQFTFVKILEKGVCKLKCFGQFTKAIKQNYKENCCIYFYDVPVYAFFFRSSRYHVFSEITEIPFFGKSPSILDRSINNIRNYALKHFTGLFVISQSLKDYYCQVGIRNLKVINMFVDCTRFDGLSKTTRDKYIGYCGTLSLYKDGVNNLIMAFSDFIKVNPNYKLRLFGRFENTDVENDLRELVKHLHLQGMVEFTGPVEAGKLPQCLIDAEMLALARPDNIQAKYGFPTKLGEYLATGNPVIVTDVGEIHSFLVNHKNAIVVEPDNNNKFTEALIWIAEHQEEARKIGMEGKKLVKSEFSSEIQAKITFDFINRLS